MIQRRKHRPAASESSAIEGSSPTAAAAARAHRRVAAALKALPETSLVPVGKHGSIEVRGKRFAWLLVDHHGDGRLAINVKCSAILAGALRDALPFGLWLDVPDLPQGLLDNAISEGFRLVAPKALLRQLA